MSRAARKIREVEMMTLDDLITQMSVLFRDGIDTTDINMDSVGSMLVSRVSPSLTGDHRVVGALVAAPATYAERMEISGKLSVVDNRSAAGAIAFACQTLDVSGDVSAADVVVGGALGAGDMSCASLAGESVAAGGGMSAGQAAASGPVTVGGEVAAGEVIADTVATSSLAAGGIRAPTLSCNTIATAAAGSLDVSGNLAVSGTASVSGDAVAGSISVTGSASFAGLMVTGTPSIAAGKAIAFAGTGSLMQLSGGAGVSISGGGNLVAAGGLIGTVQYADYAIVAGNLSGYTLKSVTIYGFEGATVSNPFFSVWPFTLFTTDGPKTTMQAGSKQMISFTYFEWP